MPLSPARQFANASNAQRSTGPRTPDGKSRSAQNARKHGLTALRLLIGPEDREEFDQLLAGCQADIAPQGALQQTLFDELVAAAWNLRRIRVMEAELYSRAATCSDLLDDDVLLTKLDRLARHKSRIERTFHRSLKELKSLQTNAAIRPMIAPQDDKAPPPLASAIEISKRTQRTPPWRAKNTLDPVELVWTAPDSAATAGA
jgi:hypothetical protein